MSGLPTTLCVCAHKEALTAQGHSAGSILQENCNTGWSAEEMDTSGEWISPGYVAPQDWRPGAEPGGSRSYMIVITAKR